MKFIIADAFSFWSVQLSTSIAIDFFLCCPYIEWLFFAAEIRIRKKTTQQKAKQLVVYEIATLTFQPVCFVFFFSIHER